MSSDEKDKGARKSGGAAISDKGKPDVKTPVPVRPAGPTTMRDPPKHWDDVDEGSDESFPASDPAAKY
jgi:hypothetical protein